MLLESLPCGTPVVATAVGDIKEVIRSPELGVLVEQDTASIARRLQLALENTWDRGALARYARSRAWDVDAEEIEEFLHARVKTEPVAARILAPNTRRLVG